MNYSDNDFHLSLFSPDTGVFTWSFLGESLHFLMCPFLIPLHTLLTLVMVKYEAIAINVPATTHAIWHIRFL